AVLDTVQGIARRQGGALDKRQLFRRDCACGVFQQRLLIPDESRKVMRPVVGRGSRDDSIEVLGVPLRFHERFTAPIRTPHEVVSRWILAVERANDRFGLHAGLMHSPMPEVHQFLRMSDGPRGVTALVAIVGYGGGVPAPHW